MGPVFKKLNLKEQAEIVVLAAPASFEPELATLRGVTVHRAFGRVRSLTFALAFVTRQAEVEDLAESVTSRAAGDAIVWFAYPKQSSKSYRCEIDRDHGWQALGRAGFEPVRVVAIDDDWSAKRFRRVENIKTMTRDASAAMTSAGKAKSAAGSARAAAAAGNKRPAKRR